MNTIGSATVSRPASVAYCADGHLADLVFAADRDDGDEAGEQRDGGDDGRADGDALGLGLGRVAHRVEVGQDLAGPLVAARALPASISSGS